MRRTLLPLVCAGLLLAPAARAADDDPKAVIAKAIKAHGGEEKLTKYPGMKAKGKGKADTQAGEIAFTSEVSSMLPDKVKDVTEFTIMGQKVRVVSLFVGTSMSIEANGMPIEIVDKAKALLKDTGYAMRVTQLVPLVKEKGFELSSLGEVKVNGKPAVGVLVKSKGHKDISLFFDKDTGLLAKSESRAADPTTGMEFNEEHVITEYQKVDGLPAPKKGVIYHDGKKHAELEIDDYKFLEKLDDSEFKK